MLRRFSDWQTRLQAYLSSSHNLPFKWAAHDCCLHTADCVQAMTGVDIAEVFRGKYSTRKEAMQAIKDVTGHTGVGAIAQYVTEQYGLSSVPITHAQRGDMVLVGKGTKAIIGIVSLSGLDVMCLSKQGIVRVAFEHATAAWRV